MKDAHQVNGKKPKAFSHHTICQKRVGMSSSLKPATHRNAHNKIFKPSQLWDFMGQRGRGRGHVALGASDAGFRGFTCTAGSTFTPPTHLTSISHQSHSRSCRSADPPRSDQSRAGPGPDYPELLREASGEHMCGTSCVWCIRRRLSEEPDHHTHISSRHFELIRPTAPHPVRIRLSVRETHPARRSVPIYTLHWFSLQRSINSGLV